MGIKGRANLNFFPPSHVCPSIKKKITQKQKEKKSLKFEWDPTFLISFTLGSQGRET